MEEKVMVVPPSQQSAQRPAEKPGEPADLAWQGSTREYKGKPKEEDKMKASITWVGSQDATGGIIEFQGVRFEQNRSLVSNAPSLIEACQKMEGFKVDILDEEKGEGDAEREGKERGSAKAKPPGPPGQSGTPPGQSKPPGGPADPGKPDHAGKPPSAEQLPTKPPEATHHGAKPSETSPPPKR